MDGVASEQAQEGLADAELLAGMRAGNSAAFAALMRSNNQRLYRLARGFLRDDLEAIVQVPIIPQGWCQFFAARENAH